MVDRLDLGLVESSVDWLLEICDVEDVGHWKTIQCRALWVHFVWYDKTLVELIVQNKVSLPVGVQDPALVAVGCTLVRSDGNNLGRIDSLLVGDVVDG